MNKSDILKLQLQGKLKITDEVIGDVEEEDEDEIESEDDSAKLEVLNKIADKIENISFTNDNTELKLLIEAMINEHKIKRGYRFTIQRDTQGFIKSIDAREI